MKQRLCIFLLIYFIFNIIACNQPVTIKHFTISFNKNGASGAEPSSMTAEKGTTIKLPGQGNLVYSSMVFNGWNTTANGSGTSYVTGATFAITTNTILYAQWVPVRTYTVTYNGNTNNSGTVPVDGSSPYQSGSTVTVLDKTGSLVKTGHNFAGWNTAANGSGTAYMAGSVFLITANTVLYAQWENISVPEPSLFVNINGTIINEFDDFTLKHIYGYTYDRLLSLTNITQGSNTWTSTLYRSLIVDNEIY